jgi:hypothetical protein
MVSVVRCGFGTTRVVRRRVSIDSFFHRAKTSPGRSRPVSSSPSVPYIDTTTTTTWDPAEEIGPRGKHLFRSSIPTFPSEFLKRSSSRTPKRYAAMADRSEEKMEGKLTEKGIGNLDPRGLARAWTMILGMSVCARPGHGGRKTHGIHLPAIARASNRWRQRGFHGHWRRLQTFRTGLCRCGMVVTQSLPVVWQGWIDFLDLSWSVKRGPRRVFRGGGSASDRARRAATCVMRRTWWRKPSLDREQDQQQYVHT